MRRLWLKDELAQQIVQHARSEHPREACGIIGGSGEQAAVVIPVANAANDPLREYRLDDQALVAAMRLLKQQSLSLLGFYHSHPDSEPIPSPMDIALATYPQTVYLIVGLRTREPQLAAWEMNYGQVTRVELVVSPQAPAKYDDTLSEAQKTAIFISALVAFVFMLLLSVSLLPPAPPIP